MNAVMDVLGEPLTVDDSPEGVRSARHEIRKLIAKATTDGDVAYYAELMASEALTNAHVHGSGAITVVVAVSEQVLRIEVHEVHESVLGTTKASPTGRVDHGRGLDLIDGLAADWGLDLDLLKTVLWFEVAV